MARPTRWRAAWAPRVRRLVLVAIASAVALPMLVVLVAWLRVAVASDEPSRSVGTSSAGRLQRGKSVPPWGGGFRTHSLLGAALGRQYLHGDARDALVASFAEAAEREPGRVFVVAEAGWRRGGRLRPHRTHQNGLSVDVLMPLRGPRGPACLSAAAWNAWGYRHELDRSGGLPGTRLAIDFDSLAEWLIDLEAQSRRRGLRVERVIVAPEYVPLLEASRGGRGVGPLSGRLMRRAAWIRHDEHVHVDFAPAIGQ